MTYHHCRFLLAFMLLPSVSHAMEPYLAIKPGFFRFQDCSVRQILGGGAFAIQAELGSMVNDYFSVALNFQYFGKSGVATNSSYLTRISVPSVALFLELFVRYIITARSM